ncbi:MAG: OmpA family protein [Acidobacteria bacterium]|nr:OmpA family protein [Acidobacteriota bacterium]
MRLRIAIGIMTIMFLCLWSMAWNKDDWEEVNFEFNSSVLVDGFPSMLQLADALGAHPDYRLAVEGHCDSQGTKAYNDSLALKRAQVVRDFLVKYGARAEQIEVAGKGFSEPKTENSTPEGRFQNRRVVFSLYVMKDGRRQEIKALSPISTILKEMADNPLLRSLDEVGKKQDGIINRLDELGKTLERLKDLQAQQARMAEELTALYQKLKDIEARPVPAPPAPVPPPAPQVADEGHRKHEKGKTHDFSLLGLNAGATRDGEFTGTISGRYFHTVTPSTALQGQGEFMYFPDRVEAQVDFGLVKRFRAFQLGGFASFKRVQMDMFEDSGTLGQAAVIGEYLFRHGSVGFYMTHAIKREAVVDQLVVGHNRMLETYLRTADQYGVNFQVAFPWESFIEGNVGWIDRGELDTKPGGTIRWVKPVFEKWSVFFEAGWNETLVSDGQTSARFVAGVRYGLWKKPGGVEPTAVEPMDIPRVRYDVRTRVVRTGNDAPIANAGGDLVNVQGGTITLDGTGSYDPDGDPITYLWTQIQGPAVTLTGAGTATPSFTAVVGVVYSFRLKVQDPFGLWSTDDVSISTRENKAPVANAGGDRVNEAAGVIQLNGSGSYDPDGDVITFQWTQVSGPAVTLTGADTATPSFTAADGQVYVFRLKVTDPYGAFSNDDVSISTRQNNPPVANAGPDLSNIPAGLVQLDGSASYDPDGDTLTFLWTQTMGPAVTLSGANTATPSFTADVDQVYVFKLKVTDAKGAFTFDEVSISTVQNRPPVAVVGPDLSNVPPGAVQLDGSASYDPDGDPLTFQWTQILGPSVALTGADTATPSFTAEAGRVYAFRLKVTDSHGLFAYADVTVSTVTAVNTPPVAYAGLDQVLLLPVPLVTLDGSGSYDPDGDPITYQWTQVDGPAVTLNNADQAMPTFTPTEIATYVFSLRVSDGRGGLATDVVRIFVF